MEYYELLNTKTAPAFQVATEGQAVSAGVSAPAAAEFTGPAAGVSDAAEPLPPTAARDNDFGPAAGVSDAAESLPPTAARDNDFGPAAGVSAVAAEPPTAARDNDFGLAPGIQNEPPTGASSAEAPTAGVPAAEIVAQAPLVMQASELQFNFCLFWNLG